MRVVLLAGASSIHTIRWANGLNAAGVEVHVVTQHPVLEPMNEGVKVHQFPFHGSVGYFTMVRGVKKLIKKIQPDLINAHYASGYATTARLVDYHPWILSVWGSDVYDFPYKSPVHKFWVKGNLKAADAVASTSHCMAKQTQSVLPSLTRIAITPFGVDTNHFASKCQPLSERKRDELVIGTVKTMAPKYGIDTLIHAFALLKSRLVREAPELASRLHLRLIGDGYQMQALKHLAKELKVGDATEFIGRIPHSEVPEALSRLDIYVALSRLDSESFGVAIIEAGAAGRPVVVSDAGGLPEVVIDQQTGVVVSRENPQAAADALYQLALNPELRIQMGEAGKAHVSATYDWNICVRRMLSVYSQTIENYRKA